MNEDKQDAVDAAFMALEKVANGNHRRFDELAKRMASDHPTLQNNYMRLVVAYINLMADKSSDMRSEAAQTFAKAVVERVSEDERNMGWII